MSQRLGIAAALLGDPQVLVLDEPVNGLDPEGILWIRNLMKTLAAEGRTVFVSSHLMNEMAVTADHLIVIGRGRLIADSSTQEFVARSADQSVLVRTPDPVRLTKAITEAGGSVTDGRTRTARKRTDSGSGPDGGGRQAGGAAALTVTGMPAARVGELAAAASVVLHELTPRTGSLEEAFMELTADSLEYGQPASAVTGRPPGRTAAAPEGQDR